MQGVLAELNPAARKTFVACFLGWSLDAFDFFLLTFVVTRIATDFNKSIPEVAFAITLTLMCRPLGAVIFGWFADRFGRRTPLMIDVALFSILELATAFSPNFTVFLVLRALYGVAMGGEWGLGAAMAMEVASAQTARLLQRPLAIGLHGRLSARRARVLRRLPLRAAARMARALRDRHAARAADLLHSRARAGVADVRRAAPPACQRCAARAARRGCAPIGRSLSTQSSSCRR